jgi:flagellar biosynthesis protein FlhB
MSEAQPGPGDKTEKASPQKLRKAREQGQAARSRDWSTAIGLLCALKLFVLMVPTYLDDFRSLFGQAFATLGSEGAQDNVWSNGFSATLLLIARMLAPLALVPLAIVAGSMIPGGWAATLTHLAPRWQRMNPAANLGRLFTRRHALDFGLSLLKVALLLIVMWQVSIEAIGDFLALQAETLDRALPHGAALMMNGVIAMAAVLLLFALIDLPLQVIAFLRHQRMSKQETKEELRSAEGRPEVRQRIRRLQQQLARRNVKKTVPGADVVVVNPQHYAVALKYDEARAEAPFLVAKGIDEMALYIRQIAEQHEVAVVTLPPLARAIYNTSQVNQQIPVPLYKAVALVLGYVLQIRAFQAGRRKTPPLLPEDLGVPAHLSEGRR